MVVDRDGTVRALRISREFRSQRHNDDRMIYRVGRNMLEGKYRWLETGIVP